MQLLSSDGQLFELSDGAARQSVTLQELAEDVDAGAPVPVPLLDSGRLQRIAALLEQTAAAFGLEGMPDERRDALLKNGLPRGDMGAQLRAATAAALEGVDGVADFATLLLDLKWFDAPLLTSVLAEGVARLLKGKSVDALRTLLEASDDLGDQEKEAALREPLFAPPAAVPAAAAPPPLDRCIAGHGRRRRRGRGQRDGLPQALRRPNASSAQGRISGLAAAGETCAVGPALDMCSSQRDRPQSLDDVEELDVEKFPREAVAAVRSMPNLARLARVRLLGRAERASGGGERQARAWGLEAGESGQRAPLAVRPAPLHPRGRG